MHYTLIIPAYNESKTIRGIVEAACAEATHVVVVDDASTDGTAELIKDLPITLLQHKENLGKAAALWHGIDYARKMGTEIIITLDADGQHRPEDIPAFLEAAQEFPGQIIIGSRLQHAEHIPPLRLFANRMANFWLSWACGYRISDSQCGFRLYPMSLFRGLEMDVRRSKSFVFESEILVKAAARGIYVHNIPIHALYEGVVQRRSYYRPFEDTWQITLMVAASLLRRGLYLKGLFAVIRGKHA
jgi:glycosyltransferase involved in cell wall biosynthesis